MLKSSLLSGLLKKTFVILGDALCDPLWFNDLCLTTKSHEVHTKAHKGKTSEIIVF